MSAAAGSQAVERLRNYFLGARTCEPWSRRVGLEVETLFVDGRTAEPIGWPTSQAILRRLAAAPGWRTGAIHGDLVTELGRGGTALKYDTGWNIFELITEPYRLSDHARLFADATLCLAELYEAAGQSGARPLATHSDGCRSDTVAPCGPSYELSRRLNGPSIRYLAHIASVHYNFDLCSVDEGMAWIAALAALYERRQWPPAEAQACWREFLAEADAGYEKRRFGAPPVTFRDYVAELAGFKVFVAPSDGGPRLVQPPRRLDQGFPDDHDLFVKFVWWWSRLRVRGGQLVLEARAVPRADDGALAMVFELLCRALGIDVTPCG